MTRTPDKYGFIADDDASVQPEKDYGFQPLSKFEQIERGATNIASALGNMLQIPSKGIMETLDDPSKALTDLYQGARGVAQDYMYPAARGLISDVLGSIGGQPLQKAVGGDLLTQKIPTYTPQDPQAAMTQIGGAIPPMLAAGPLGGAAETAVGAGAELLPEFAGKQLLTRGAQAVAGEAARAAPYPGDELTNMTTGLATRGVLHAAANAVPAVKNAKAMIGNRIIDRLNKASEKTATLNPEETLKNLMENYRSSDGEFLPADIGSLSGDKDLINKYENLSLVPGSKVKQKISEVEEGQKQAVLSNLNQAKNMLSQRSNPLDVVQQQYAHMGTHLPYGMSDRQYVHQGTNEMFKQMNKIGNDKYTALENTPLQLNVTDGAGFPKYTSALKALSNDQINNLATFGGPSDFTRPVRAETQKGISALSLDPEDVPFTLPDAIRRIKSLNKGINNAYKANDGESARLLTSLKNGLESDTKNILNSAGRSDIVRDMDSATAHWRDLRSPFVSQDNTIKNISFNKNMPTSEQMVKAFYKPSNKNIYNMLPSNVKNSLVRLAMNKDMEFPGSQNKVSGEDLLKNYISQDSGMRQALAGGYHMPKRGPAVFEPGTHPMLDTILSEANKDLPTYKANQKRIEEINKQIQKLNKAPEGAKVKNVGLPELGKAGAAMGASVAAFHHPGALGKFLLPALAGTGYGRYMANILRDPELRDAYIQGRKLKIDDPVSLGQRFADINSAIAATTNNQGGQ